MNVALVNDPALVVLVVPVNVTGIPLNVAVMLCEPLKPVPEIDTVEPMFPLVGFRVIVGMTYNVAVPVFELASVAITVFKSATAVGTVKVQTKPPNLVVVTEPID